MSPTEVLRRAWAPSLATGLLAPPLLALVPTVVLTPLFGLLVMGCLRAQLRAATGTGVSSSVAPGFLLAVLTGAGLLGAVLGATAASSLMAPAPAAIVGVGAALLPLLGLVLLAPFSFVPLAWLERAWSEGTLRARIGGAFGDALEGWRRVPWASRLRWLAMAATPWLVAATLVGVEAEGSTWFEVLAPTVAFAVPFASAQLVASWCEVRDSVRDARASAKVPRTLGFLALAASFASLLALAALGWAVLAPLPMAESPLRWASTPALQPPSRGWHRGPFALPGSTLVVRPGPEGVRIDAEDGGGTGLVRLPGGADEVRAEAFEGGYRVYGQGPGGRGVVEVDALGVRRDDSFGDRVGARLGAVGAFMAAGLLFAWGMALLAAVRVQRARVLRDLPATGGAGAERCVLEGRLVLGDGARVRRAGSRIVADGPAWVEGGSLRVRLPSEGVRVQGALVQARHGARVVLVGRFAQHTSAAFREAAAPWPAQARLVFGDRRAAVRGEVARASVLAGVALTSVVLVALGLALWIVRGI